MEATYSISTFIKSNIADGNNALIYLRTTVSGERAEISIKRTIDRDRWDAAANLVRGNKEMPERSMPYLMQRHSGSIRSTTSS